MAPPERPLLVPLARVQDLAAHLIAIGEATPALAHQLDLLRADIQAHPADHTHTGESIAATAARYADAAITTLHAKPSPWPRGPVENALRDALTRAVLLKAACQRAMYS